MAEFCKKCAPKHGHYFEGYPVMCEACGIYQDRKELWIAKWARQAYMMLVEAGVLK